MSEPAETCCGPKVGPEHMGGEVICVTDLSYRYPDGHEALRDVNLHVRRGSTLAIVGPNGAGKTTLLKILLGLLHGYDGEVHVAGQTPDRAARTGGVLGWVPQKSKTMWEFPVSVAQVVRMGLVGKTGMFRRHRREDLDYVEELLDLLDIRGIAERPVGQLSGGQQQRTIIARALAPRPEVLLLDEPTVGVDQAGQQAFAELMKRIQERFGITLVIVSHDLRAILPECERIACINRTLHFHDTPARLTPELLEDVFRCDLTGLYPARRVGEHGPAPLTRQIEPGEGTAP